MGCDRIKPFVGRAGFGNAAVPTDAERHATDPPGKPYASLQCKNLNIPDSTNRNLTPNFPRPVSQRGVVQKEKVK